jgi:hypothetical protein
MSDYRKFSVAAQLGIAMRATDASGRIHCEICGVWVKRRKDYEIDHRIAERLRPLADRLKPLAMADGQLVCLACHAEKTRDDVGDIAEAKRREAAAHGIERPGKKKIPHRKAERAPYRPAAGPPGIARRFK